MFCKILKTNYFTCGLRKMKVMKRKAFYHILLALFMVNIYWKNCWSSNVLVNLLQLHCVGGNIIVASGENVVDVPFLKPDEQGELVVAFITPPVPGYYER